MRHKLFAALLCGALSIASCFGCSDSSNDDPDNGGNVAGSGITLVDGQSTSLSFTNKGGSQTVSFNVPTATIEVEVVSSESWLTVSQSSSSAGVRSYAVKAAANSSTEVRTATVTFSAKGYEDDIVINATQERYVTTEEAMVSDAKTLISKIYAGINIGNTMECNNSNDETAETAWGNPLVNEDYIKGLKALGFNAVRIPCAWHSHILNLADETYTISPKWLERVKTVVSYCVDNDMYVVLNSHWDTGWLEDNIFLLSVRRDILNEQTAIWTQIANYFNEFDEHLIFAGANEPGMNETSGHSEKWGERKGAEAITRLISYEQAFIDAVRATGGNNALRCLIFQGLGADISSTSDYMTTLPTDKVENRLIAEVHFYEPYQWALMTEDASWGNTFYYWGKDNHKDGSAHNPTWGEESHVDSQMAKMKAKFVDNGIPVIIGEFSSRILTYGPDSDEALDQDLHKRSRAYYNQYVTKVAKDNGCAPFYWETGSEINRTDGTAKNQYAIDGIMEGASQGQYPF